MISTAVGRVSESEFFKRLTEIEEEFNVKLDDLGIEWSMCTHPEDVDEEMSSIRFQVRKKLADRIVNRWAREYREIAQGKKQEEF